LHQRPCVCARAAAARAPPTSPTARPRRHQWRQGLGFRDQGLVPSQQPGSNAAAHLRRLRRASSPCRSLSCDLNPHVQAHAAPLQHLSQGLVPSSCHHRPLARRLRPCPWPPQRPRRISSPHPLLRRARAAPAFCPPSTKGCASMCPRPDHRQRRLRALFSGRFPGVWRPRVVSTRRARVPALRRPSHRVMPPLWPRLVHLHAPRLFFGHASAFLQDHA
jgi:hypothetical protein